MNTGRHTKWTVISIKGVNRADGALSNILF